MSTLTAQEKTAGRAFRDEAQARLLATFDTDPPDFTVPNFIALFRHNCTKRRNRSTALELKEIYEVSPAYQDVPAGRFAFIWRDGTCRLCGQTARSRAGRLVLTDGRPPLQGRVARS